jgi:hypothetical protein
VSIFRSSSSALKDLGARVDKQVAVRPHSIMKSKLADDARRRRNEDLGRMTPEDRLAAYDRHCQLLAQLRLEGEVVSTDRRNTCLKFLFRRSESQRFPRSFVKFSCHVVQPDLAVDGQICVLGEVLAQQPVGVLIRAALSWALRVAEVHLNIGRHGEPVLTS